MAITASVSDVPPHRAAEALSTALLRELRGPRPVGTGEIPRDPTSCLVTRAQTMMRSLARWHGDAVGMCEDAAMMAEDEKVTSTVADLLEFARDLPDLFDAEELDKDMVLTELERRATSALDERLRVLEREMRALHAEPGAANDDAMLAKLAAFDEHQSLRALKAALFAGCALLRRVVIMDRDFEQLCTHTKDA